MTLTAPYRQHNYMGEFANDAAALTFIQTNEWDSNGDGTGNPQAGMLYYNTTSTVVRMYNGSAWVDLATGVSSPWEETATVVELVTGSNTVAIGASVMSGSEKLRVVGTQQIDTNGKLIIADSATIPPLNITERATEPSSPTAGDIYLDDGSNTASGNPGWRRCVSTGPDVWEDISAVGGASLWTQDTGFAYLTTTTDSVVIGDTALTGSEKLKVDGGDILVEGGSLRLPETPNDGSEGVIYMGTDPILSRVGPSLRNIFVGDAGNFLGAGSFADDIGIGNGALAAIGTGDRCIAIGTSAGAVNSSFSDNIYIGYQAGLVNNQSNNTVLGANALTTATTTAAAVVIGEGAAGSATSANNCVLIGTDVVSAGPFSGNTSVFIGTLSGRDATSVSGCVVIGSNAGQFLTSGDNNVAVGEAAGRGLLTGTDNVAIGYRCIGGNGVSGGICTQNVAIGSEAMESFTSSSSTRRNVAVGYRALRTTTAGAAEGNTAVGYAAGNTNGAADFCVYVGHLAGVSNTTSNRLFIHASSASVGDGTLLYGEFDTPFLRINGTAEQLDDHGTGTFVGIRALNQKDAGGTTTLVGIESQLEHIRSAFTTDNSVFTGFLSDIDVTLPDSPGDDRTFPNFYGYRSQLDLSADVGTNVATVTDWRSIWLETPTNASGTSTGIITTAHGLYVDDQGPLGTTTTYGIYVASQSGGTALGLYVDDDVEITGKLTVAGLIDPTGMVFTEQTTVPGGAPGAGFGTVWVRDDAPNVLMFTDDAGTDWQISGVGSSPWTTTSNVIHPVTLTDQVGVGKITGAGLGELMFVIDDEEDGSGSTLVTQLEKDSTGTRSTWIGLNSLAVHSGAGAGTDYRGVESSINNVAAATITDAYCYVADGRVTNASGEITNFYAYFVDGVTSTGTLDNFYGLYISAISADTGSYGIYQAGDDEVNYFAGQVSINDATPSGSVYLLVTDDDDTNSRFGIISFLDKDGAGAGKDWDGFVADATHTGDVNADTYNGFRSTLDFSVGNTRTITTYDAFRAEIQITDASDTVTTYRGLYIEAPVGSGTITTSIGVQIDELAGSSSYGIYQSGGADRNYFAGIVGIASVPGGLAFLDIDWQADLTVGTLFGTTVDVDKTGTDATTEFRAYNTELNIDTGNGTLGAYKGFNVSTPTGTAAGTTITTMYGLYVESLLSGPAASGTAYGVYQAGTSDINYFGGNVGINKTSPASTRKLDVVDDSASATTYGIYSTTEVSGSATKLDSAAIFAKVDYTSSGTTTDLGAFRSSITNTGTNSGTITNASGYISFMDVTTGETITNARHFHVIRPTVGSGTVTNAYGVYIEDMNFSSLVGTAYGIYIANQNGSVLTYGIYQDSTSDINILRGQTCVGGTTVVTSAALEIQTTTGALLVSRMTTTQRNALTAVNGMIIYNTTTSAFNFRENGAWVTGSGLA